MNHRKQLIFPESDEEPVHIPTPNLNTPDADAPVAVEPAGAAPEVASKILAAHTVETAVVAAIQNSIHTPAETSTNTPPKNALEAPSQTPAEVPVDTPIQTLSETSPFTVVLETMTDVMETTTETSSEPSNEASIETKAISEETPLLSSSDVSQQLYRPFPAMLEDPAGPVADIHSRFGFGAFLKDVSDVRNGSVPVSVIIAFFIGLFCGIAAFFYYRILEFFLEFLWKTLPERIAHAFPIWMPSLYWTWIPIMGMSMAVLVGLSIKVLGFPGDLAYTVKCVHKDAYVPMSHAPSMVVASQVSILGGGSLGPEAPLVAICASIAGWVSINLFRQKYKNIVRKHTLCGMACALAAFFGVPLGGSLFALEINNRLGYEYFEHALEAILSGTVCLVVFRGLAGLPIGPIWDFGVDALKDSSARVVCLGAILGLVGAGLAAIFAHCHWFVMKKLKSLGWDADPLKLSIFGGVGICTLGLLVPHSLFWGEFEIETIGSLSPASALSHVWPTTGLTEFEITNAFTAFIVGVAKLAAVSFTVAGGYRGGFIFPFFCAGTAFGRCVTYLFPNIPPVVAMLSIAAGINVTITRTALATPLILAALAGEVNSVSPVLAASLAAVFVTYYMPFIFSQQGREELFESQLHSYTFKDKWGEAGEDREISIANGGETDIERN